MRAIPGWIDTRLWFPHSYIEITPMSGDQTIKNVYVSNRGIRIKHFYCPDATPDEILIEKVPIKRYICKKCGKELIVFDNTWGKKYEEAKI